MAEDISSVIKHLNKLNEIGIALSAERDMGRLLEQILSGAMVISNADAGTIYIVEDDQRLTFEVLANNSLAIVPGRITESTFDPIPLFEAGTGEPNKSTVVTSVYHDRATINISDVYHAADYDFSGTHKFDERSGYKSQSLLTIPMMNHENDIIGVLQLINSLDDQGRVVEFNAEKQQLAESLASQAAVALTNKRLIDELNALFDAFVKLIATAIDEKSPYTGGHCRRVPELTMMLAEAASESDIGDLRDFHLNDDDRYELSVASWLHDCGKITTPEYVMDKSTKLETIYDRIHEVDLRFEVMKRDAEIETLREKLERTRRGESTEGLDEVLYSRLRTWDEQKTFLQESNIGGEFMDDDQQHRVREIAAQTYSASGGRQPLLSAEEVENLTIAKGTLTDEERNVINHHIVATIKMLESLPFPKMLQNVPEYAGGHHERMDGKGYPRGLTREQMSVPARVMAIADVFEALTAVDRPYKKGKKLSECLTIMGRMKEDNHIDPELFQVFIDSKVYLRYAEQFIKPDQIDEIDLSTLPGYTAVS
jgi:HD-GYP domain-containing protein (c-di-GMP phosphodiesterase class II)